MSNMKSLFEINQFANKKYLLLDGGLSSHLEDQGAQFTKKLWSSYCLLNNPDEIQKAHTQFLCKIGIF